LKLRPKLAIKERCRDEKTTLQVYEGLKREFSISPILFLFSHHCALLSHTKSLLTVLSVSDQSLSP